MEDGPLEFLRVGRLITGAVRTGVCGISRSTPLSFFFFGSAIMRAGSSSLTSGNPESIPARVRSRISRSFLN